MVQICWRHLVFMAGCRKRISFPDHIKWNILSIKFTMEHENDSGLPFLDCRVHRADRKFKYSFYRKPWNISWHIQHYSSQNNKEKQSAFLSMFLRALRICSLEYLDNGIEKIVNINIEHKYPDIFLQESLRNQRKFYTTVIHEKNLTVTVCLFSLTTKYFWALPQQLNNINVNVVYKNTITVYTVQG